MRNGLTEEFTRGIDFAIEQLERRIRIWQHYNEELKIDKARIIIKDLRSAKSKCEDIYQ